MVFSSLTFMYIFLPVVLLTYFIAPNIKAKNFILFLSGLFFYGWGEPVYLILMVLSSLLDYFAGILLEKHDNDEKMRKQILVWSLVIHIGTLAIFKYSSFIIENLNALLRTSIPDPKLPLPIGISFYLFQSMSYTIDVYWRKVRVQKSAINYISYVALFPQIVAGPIVRYEDVENEMDNRTVNINVVGDGVGIFVKGLTKKIFLANNIGTLWTTIKAMDYNELSVVTAWLGILAFTLQIYYDFSGYSDMAIGLGKMLGFNFPANFNHPYISRSIAEFWRRWHMTLGGWFKAYVYIPLGGNRKGLKRTLINTAIVWGLTGLWHGASWNFIIWGLYFGVLIMIERLGFGKILEKAPPFVSTLYTFIMVVFGWVFFDTATMSDAVKYIGAMFGAGGTFIDSFAKYQMASYGIMFVLCIVGSTELFDKCVVWLREKPQTKKWFYMATPIIQGLIMLFCTSYLVDATYNPFLYFRF